MEEGKNMLEHEATIEDVLLFLRRNECSKIDSIRALMLVRDLSIAEAKEIVHFSQAWKDSRESDEGFHAQLEAAMELERDPQNRLKID